MIGFKKGLSASQIKKARVARKIGVVVGATILTAGAASAIAGSVGAAGAAGSAAGAAGSAGSAGTAASGAGLFSKLIGKAPQAMDMVKRARKAFNLPALTAGTFLKKGSPRAVAAGEELDAANKASDAVKNGTMTQEQADEYLANAIRNSEARARDAEARLEAERRRKQEAGEAASARQAEEQAVAGTPPSKPEEAGIGAGKAGLVVAAVLLAILAGSKGKPLTAKAAR
jgi:polyhydroxyalkanoate synthesis regulator phasin